jgi:small neutral amino acid transporter SnatA (MarC family)
MPARRDLAGGFQPFVIVGGVVVVQLALPGIVVPTCRVQRCRRPACRRAAGAVVQLTLPLDRSGPGPLWHTQRMGREDDTKPSPVEQAQRLVLIGIIGVIPLLELSNRVDGALGNVLTVVCGVLSVILLVCAVRVLIRSLRQRSLDSD